jgi:outer membrane protein assembly factor BamB
MDVTTYHNDVARTGQNLNENILTPGNVNSSNFGKLFVIPVDGKVDAEPLYLGGVTIPSKGTHNVLYAVTEHGTVYATDADTGTNLWQVSMLQAGETASDNRGCGQIAPEIGITATPVIDRKAGANGTIYVVAMSKDSSGGYHQRLHALDVTTGAEEFGGPQNIQASVRGTGDNSSGGTVIFDPGQYAERAGLLLLNGVIYTSWTSHCDIRPYTGWMMGYDQNTLAQVTVLNVTPNGNEGAIWMSGTAPAADSSGNIYALDGNGVFDSTLNSSGFPSEGDFGNAFLKISTANKQLAVADYFEMSNQSSENSTDEDLGSGGALVLPDLVRLCIWQWAPARMGISTL